MEVLDLKPVKGKEVFVCIIGKEDEKLVIDEMMMLKEILNDYQFKFTTIDPTYDNLKTFKLTTAAEMLNNHGLSCYAVDIPEYAQGYLEAEITEKRDQIAGLEAEYDGTEDKTTFKAQNLKSWIELLKDEARDKEDFMDLTLRPQWIVKKIMDIIRLGPSQEETVTIMHFTSKRLIPELKKQLEDLQVKVTVFGVLPMASRTQRQARTVSQEITG